MHVGAKLVLLLARMDDWLPPACGRGDLEARRTLVGEVAIRPNATGPEWLWHRIVNARQMETGAFNELPPICPRLIA
jgi:hypothetical protein